MSTKHQWELVIFCLWLQLMLMILNVEFFVDDQMKVKEHTSTIDIVLPSVELALFLVLFQTECGYPVYTKCQNCFISTNPKKRFHYFLCLIHVVYLHAWHN